MSTNSSVRSKPSENGNGRASKSSKADAIFSDLKGRPFERELKPGEALFRAGQRTVGAYHVVTGRVRLVRTDRRGRETVLYTVGPDDLIAEASLFSPVYHCDAIASVGSKIRLYPKRAVLASFKRNSEAAAAFMARLASQLMQLRAKVELRNIHSARERVRHYLALNAGADGATLLLGGTLKDLATDLGLTHEAFYRVLAEMAADGEIKRPEGRIVRVLSYDPDHTRERKIAV